MRHAVTTLLVLAFITCATAQDTRPTLPRVPRGFDEGRTAFVAETADGLIAPGALVERLFEEADLVDIAGFTFAHLTPDEKRSLDESLKLGGLIKANDAAAVHALLGTRKPADVAKAIGQMLVRRKFTLSDVGTWLYARGFNFNVLQRALNGERLDAWRLRRSLRGRADRSAAAVFKPGLWEFNLKDAREEKGGIYDGAQLVEILLALGWKTADFARAVRIKELPETRRELIEWGDAALIWTMLEAYVSESEMVQRIIERYKANDDPRVLELALSRAATTTRWFRTGGPGVCGVYRGPWPSGKGDPKPPTSRVLELSNLDVEQFADALDDSIRGHFDREGETLTMVLYDDGSARAILDKPGRELLEYSADTPFGATSSTLQAYEGRLTLQGRSALMYLVFAGGVKSAPPEFEFANVNLAADGAFLVADLDDGLNLTPLMLRRVSRLID